MTESIRPLPILTAGEPTAEDWATLRAAKTNTGYQGMVMPRPAVYGSPGIILAVGKLPDWLCKFVYVDSLEDPRLTDALKTILDVEWTAPVYDEADLLSKWLGEEVTLVETFEMEEVL